MLVIVFVRRVNYERSGNKETQVRQIIWKQSKKKGSKRSVYQSKGKAERKKFGNVMGKDNQKCGAFKIAKMMVKTNQDVIGEQCIRNDDGVLAFSDKDSLESYRKKHLSIEFALDRNSLSRADRLSDVPRSIDKDMVGESKKAGKDTELSGLVSKMIKATGEAGVDMITDVVNQIRVLVIPVEWELSTMKSRS